MYFICMNRESRKAFNYHVCFALQHDLNKVAGEVELHEDLLELMMEKVAELGVFGVERGRG